jgi:glycosyltransferase involved in cell wall biosynthesis
MKKTQMPGYLFVLGWSISLGAGGVNEVVRTLYRLFASGPDFTPLVLEPCWDKGTSVGTEDGFDVLKTRIKRPVDGRFRWASLASFLLTLPMDLLALTRLLHRFQVEVVNPHFPSLECVNFFLLRMLRLYRGRIVLSLHGADMFAIARSSGLERRLWQFMFRKADCIVACAGSLERQVISFAPGTRTALIYNGIDVNAFLTNRSRNSIPTELAQKRFVLNIGRFEHKKGQDVLLKAFQRVRREMDGLHLVIVGNQGPELGAVRQCVSDLGLFDHVTLWQNIAHEEIADLMEAASVFVLPSRREAFPIVLLEAGAVGLPVVATNVDGVPELIREGRDGLLVPPNDCAALADAILDLLGNREKAKELAGNLRARVEEVFTWTHAAELYLSACTRKTTER